MTDLKDGMMEMAQYQMETAQYQAMASAPSPMKKDFYAALYNNVMDSMSYKVQKRALDQQEMAVMKRRLAIKDAELELKEKELMLKNMELDCKLIGEKSGGEEEEGKTEYDPINEIVDSHQNITNTCSWPNCFFGTTLSTERYQKCRVNFLHHACQTEWKHNNELNNEELRKLCYSCAQEFFVELK